MPPKSKTQGTFKKQTFTDRSISNGGADLWDAIHPFLPVPHGSCLFSCASGSVFIGFIWLSNTDIFIFKSWYNLNICVTTVNLAHWKKGLIAGLCILLVLALILVIAFKTRSPCMWEEENRQSVNVSSCSYQKSLCSEGEVMRYKKCGDAHRASCLNKLIVVLCPPSLRKAASTKVERLSLTQAGGQRGRKW